MGALSAIVGPWRSNELVDKREAESRLAAGVDISTGHAVDSWLSSDPVRDPWAEESVCLFVDALVNNSRVCCPLPTAKAVRNLSAETLPESFEVARQGNLISMVTQQTAEEVVLGPANLRSEWLRFEKWGRMNSHNLHLWARFHRASARLRGAHDRELNSEYYVHDFWMNEVAEQMPNWWELDPKLLQYTFDVFVRATQYSAILSGTSDYRPHPLRQQAAEVRNSDSRAPRSLAPWGNYLLEAKKLFGFPRHVEELMETAVRVRQAVEKVGATSDLLPSPLDREASERLQTAAHEAGLPGKLQDYVQKRLKAILQTGTAASAGIMALAAQGPLPLASSVGFLTMLSGYLVVQAWDGTVPGKVSSLKVTRGLLEFPGLGLNKAGESVAESGT